MVTNRPGKAGEKMSIKMLRERLETKLKCLICLLPQDYETFFDAKEDNAVFAFLGLPPPPGSKVGIQLSLTFLK